MPKAGSKMNRLRKCFLAIVAFLLVTVTLLSLLQTQQDFQIGQYRIFGASEEFVIVTYPLQNFSHGRWRQLSQKQITSLSVLGRIVFLDEKPLKLTPLLKSYTVLIWRHGFEFENRHINQYTKYNYNPFEHCSVSNCRIKYTRTALQSADIVVFNLQQISHAEELLLNEKRNPHQIWAFLTEKSPLNTFAVPYSLAKFNYLFNWSMTYRMDADIPVPYGRTVMLNVKEAGVVHRHSKWNKNKKQDVLAAIVISACRGRNYRWSYIRKLQQYITVHIYGHCGLHRCESDIYQPNTHFANDCREISQYKFYLAFENSNCDEYITEKVWWFGFSKKAIPVVMGGSSKNYRQLLPPNSYINVEDFASPRDLASYLLYLNRTPEHIQQFFQWKRHFRIKNEHGYFHTHSSHYCRICEALNYNSRDVKVYSDLYKFWISDKCHRSWNVLKPDEHA